MSTHQYPGFPGNGWVNETGQNKGQGFNIPIPLPPGSGDDVYLKALQRFLPIADKFKPDIIGVSAGFDAHKDDLLGSMKLTSEDYGELTRIVKGIADKHCKGRVISFLEGGYNLDAIAESVEKHILVLQESSSQLE